MLKIPMMLGVILCGGDSTRMGRDKGLLPFGTQTWAGSAAKKMATLDIPIVLSVNERQLPLYAGQLSDLPLIPDDPTLGIKGPLAGVLNVHASYPAEDLFVLACDIPFIEPMLLHDLFLRRSVNPAAQAYLYTIGGEPEPLCGIYTAAGLTRISELHRTGRLLRHSMKYALEQLPVDSVPVPGGKTTCFKNVNYPPASGC